MEAEIKKLISLNEGKKQTSIFFNDYYFKGFNF